MGELTTGTMEEGPKELCMRLLSLTGQSGELMSSPVNWTPCLWSLPITPMSLHSEDILPEETLFLVKHTYTY